MSILFGHPTGNPNSHQAAVAYLEAGLLECFCVPWMPSTKTIQVLKGIKPLESLARRLERRQFPPLSRAPKVQGRVGEVSRLLIRASGFDDGRCADQGNRWLMRTMARECRRSAVTAVHAYEDCSLWPFVEAKRLGKACVYDLPTSYYRSWEMTQGELGRIFSDWLPTGGFAATDSMRQEQKHQEMELAELIMVASRFVEGSVREFYPHKEIVRTPYGVDLDFWRPRSTSKPSGPLRFVYAGQVSVRKGIPLLIEAWAKASLTDAELQLVGSWQLAETKRRSMPSGIRWFPPCSAQALRDRYTGADVFVFPSFSDGFGLVLLEAMACGLPAIASEESIGPEVIVPGCGFVTSPGNVDQLVELLRWFDRNRGELPSMGREARSQAARWTWTNYRSLVTRAVMKFA